MELRCAMPLPCQREWYEKNIEQPRREQEAARRKTREAIAASPKLPVEDYEASALEAISRVRFIPGTYAKRFAREMAYATEITGNQRLFLWSIVWRYRRQIADKRLVELARAFNAKIER